MEIILTSAAGILGAILASFIAVIAERVHTGQPWWQGRSRCNSCREDLHARDLIPVVSWMLAGGRCRRCGSRLPVAYLVGEVALGSLFALSVATLGISLQLVWFLAALGILFFIVLYDLRHTVVPPLSSLLLFVAALGFALAAGQGAQALGATLLVAAGCALFLFLLFVFSRGRAMGLGDTPVVFSLALLTGASQAIAGLLFSFWIGALFGIGILLARRGGPTMGIEVPFVPFLAAGFLLAFFTQWHPFSLLIF